MSKNCPSPENPCFCDCHLEEHECLDCRCGRHKPEEMTPHIHSEWAENKAKEIIGKWGYEEEYWWKPITEALTLSKKEAKEEVLRDLYEMAGKVVCTNFQIENDGITIYQKIKEYAKQQGIELNKD